MVRTGGYAAFFPPFSQNALTNSNMNISFLGLGIMGSRMAANLLQNGTSLTVWNRSPEASQPMADLGATVASSAAEALADADVVFTMFSTPEAVSMVMFGPEAGLSQMKSGSLWVDCSTVNPGFSRESAAEAAQRSIRFLDAPVAGSKPQAEAAQLLFFVGGSQEDLEPVQPLMEQMGQKVLHIGGLGMGASFKMLVNAMLAQSMLAFSETVLLGEKLGLDRDFLLNTLPNLAVAAPFTKAKAEMIRAQDYEVQFPLELMHKDLHLAALSAYEVGQPLYLANLTKELFASAKHAGMGRLDFSAIHAFLEGK